jgi:hypothetical protein
MNKEEALTALADMIVQIKLVARALDRAGISHMNLTRLAMAEGSLTRVLWDLEPREPGQKDG